VSTSAARGPHQPWRPALQILPLAIELAFEPRDPERLLELLTLPDGPFAHQKGGGYTLAGAVSRSPGIGGPRWLEARQVVLDRLEPDDRQEWLARAGSWLEGRS
jgi:ATP-dependent helicase/nuclease subunit B